jgi:aminodeoxyfutalosine deaminase
MAPYPKIELHVHLALFDTDLGREHAAARSLGVDPRSLYEAGVAGALCDAATRERLAAIGAAYDWSRAGEGT